MLSMPIVSRGQLKRDLSIVQVALLRSANEKAMHLYEVSHR